MVTGFRDWLRTVDRPLRHIAVLTGAGISAESGLPTFRGADGLWQGKDPASLFTPEALADDPAGTWTFYDALRARIAESAPNAGHLALARLAEEIAVTLATQNIDGLHQRAGSRNVLELHGTLWRLRCATCAYAESNTAAPLPVLPPRCPWCTDVLRPDIVLFTEALPEDAFAHAWEAAAACDLMLVVGTSGVVYPAAGLPMIAHNHGALVVEINPDDTPLTPKAHLSIHASAADGLPEIVAALLEQ
jgi:NAD-dependent deacetylase